MPNDGQIDPRWRRKPPPLPSGQRVIPDPYFTMLMELRWCFWEVPVFERQCKDADARVARGFCIKAAKRIRNTFDPHPEVGPEAADAFIAWQVHFARKMFAEDVKNGYWRWEPGSVKMYS